MHFTVLGSIHELARRWGFSLFLAKKVIMLGLD